MPPRRPSFLKVDDNQNPIFIPNLPFVGRRDILERIDEMFSLPQAADEYRVLNVYGVGGQGKTSLAQQFLKQLRQKRESQGEHVATASLNFETEAYRRDPALALLSIRHQLRRQGIIFPAFDTAFGRYFMLTQQGRDIKSVHPELFHQSSEFLGDLEGMGGDILEDMGGFAKDLVEEIPGVGAITKNLGKLSNNLQRWWQRRGNSLLKDLDSIEPHQITELLPTYLASDLYEWLSSSEPNQVNRLTLVFDTYEALWRERANKVGTTTILVDQWVQQLVNDAIGAYVVILGREALSWHKQDSEWSKYITGWRLDELGLEAAEELLSKVPVEESDIRSAMLASSERVAFYLKLHIEHYAELKNRQQQPVVDDFIQAQNQIIARFMGHMEPGMRQALNVCSCPRFVTGSLFLKLTENFLGGKAAVNFHDLLHYSFWEEPEESNANELTYRLHNVMREQLQALLKLEQSDLIGQIHQYLFEMYDGVFEGVAAINQVVIQQHAIEHPYDDVKYFGTLLKPHEGEVAGFLEQYDSALQEVLYHLGQVDSKRLSEWLSLRDGFHQLSADWALLQPLWEYVLHITERDKWLGHVDVATSLNNLGGIYASQGKYTIAEPLYQRALSIRETELGQDHLDTAISLNDLAKIYEFQAKYAEAERLYERALIIYRSQLGVGHLITAAGLNNLAGLYEALGRYSEAEPLYQSAIQVYESELGANNRYLAAVLSNLAVLYESQGKYVEAEHLHLRTLEIYGLPLGADHRYVAASLVNLAITYESQDKYNEAEIFHQRALEVYEPKSGTDHPNMAPILNNLAGLYKSQGRLNEAEPLYRRAISICETQLGEDHPHTAICLDNLAHLYQKQVG